MFSTAHNRLEEPSVASEIKGLALESEYVVCALCGEENAKIKFKIDVQDMKLVGIWLDGIRHKVRNTETIVACNSCSLVYVNPRLKLKRGMVAYSREQQEEYFESSRESRSRAYRDLIYQIPSWLGREAQTLLDIGCGDGVLLEAARQEGIDSVGTEISDSLICQVRKRLGAEAILSVGLADLPDSCYDVIMLINVLEHMPNPDEILTSAVRLLKPHGILLAHTPNIGGLPARIKRASWHQIEPLEHFYYFNSVTLKGLLRKAGLEPIDRFNLIVSQGIRGKAQYLLGKLGIYVDNGLGIVARRSQESTHGIDG